MTEAEWLACDDPRPMLAFLRDRASERKLRLFAAVCCRRIWRVLTDERSRKAVEVSEKYADGAAGERERAEAHELVTRALQEAWVVRQASPHTVPEAFLLGASAARLTAGAPDGRDILDCGAALAVVAACSRIAGQRASALGGRRRLLAACGATLRELLGPLAFRTVPVPPYWLAWNNSTVPRLAQSVYEERAFDRLPVLADALEDAGCTDAEILGHCRSGGEHVRGCWAVDLLLGKE